MAKQNPNQAAILKLGKEISQEEIEQSNRIFELLSPAKQVVGARLLSKKRQELYLEFEDGTRLFVDVVNGKLDISIT